MTATIGDTLVFKGTMGGQPLCHGTVEEYIHRLLEENTELKGQVNSLKSSLYWAQVDLQEASKI